MKILGFLPYVVAAVGDVLILIVALVLMTVLSIAGIFFCSWNMIVGYIERNKNVDFKLYEETDGGPIF